MARLVPARDQAQQRDRIICAAAWRGCVYRKPYSSWWR